MSDFVQVEGKFVRETDKAICINMDGEDMWIPLSLVDHVSKDKYGCRVDVEEWFAEKEGLDYR